MPRELFFPDLWRTKGRCWYLDLPLFPAQQQKGGGQIDIGLDQREERVTIGLDSQTSIATMTKRACN